jgi:hypothetical protein
MLLDGVPITIRYVYLYFEKCAVCKQCLAEIVLWHTAIHDMCIISQILICHCVCLLNHGYSIIITCCGTHVNTYLLSCPCGTSSMQPLLTDDFVATAQDSTVLTTDSTYMCKSEMRPQFIGYSYYTCWHIN